MPKLNVESWDQAQAEELQIAPKFLKAKTHLGSFEKLKPIKVSLILPLDEPKMFLSLLKQTNYFEWQLKRLLGNSITLDKI